MLVSKKICLNHKFILGLQYLLEIIVASTTEVSIFLWKQNILLCIFTLVVIHFLLSA